MLLWTVQEVFVRWMKINMGKSSRDKRDVYYRFAKEGRFRARSAYKLIQINEEFDLFNGISHVVDLCAAPGSWSQVVSERLVSEKNGMERDVKLVAVDLQAMAPLPGVVQIQGDITKKETAEVIIEHFEGKYAHLVLCDGAPDVTGLPDFDEYIQAQLLLAAFNIATNVLAPGGTFLAKLFCGKDVAVLLSLLQLFFKQVTVAKPRTSRNSSIESFVLCKTYCPPSQYVPSINAPVICVSDLSVVDHPPVPFKVCGSEVSYDSDTNYPLQLDDSKSYEYREPEHAPVLPPYAHYLTLQHNHKIQTPH